ncbi:MAG TPA: YggS family pyridoxal phosphate-dependent enzyme [Candidatus Dormibacteraeota bacterium]|nr:YggS family pyridoxal phosphate-dependent enzyme [Candidatus Dormibacteraeota bacterium]
MEAVPPVANRLARVRARITAAALRSERDPSDVRLIAVSKGMPAARVDAAIDAGVEDIGENRIQEAADKQREVRNAARWHLIGHLQTNKAARAAALFDFVHSVDSLRVADALSTHRPPGRDPIGVLLEVELTGLPTRYGVAESDVEAVVQQLVNVPAIHLMGLMTIAPFSDDPEDARASFVRLRHIRDHMEHATGWALPELSMGMSNDFEIAIEEGATMVRVGRAIFGEPVA